MLWFDFRVKLCCWSSNVAGNVGGCHLLWKDLRNPLHGRRPHKIMRIANDTFDGRGVDVPGTRSPDILYIAARSPDAQHTVTRLPDT